MEMFKKLVSKLLLKYDKYIPSFLSNYINKLMSAQELFRVQSVVVTDVLYFILDMNDRDHFDYRNFVQNFGFIKILEEIEQFIKHSPCFIIIRFRTRYLSNAPELLFKNKETAYKDIVIFYRSEKFEKEGVTEKIQNSFLKFNESYSHLSMQIYGAFIEVRKTSGVSWSLKKEKRLKIN